MKFRVIDAHRSEYPEPITFAKGAPLSIGERYEGEEGWDNWYWCSTAGQPAGWVPGQVIERLGDDQGIALEDYCARELEVQAGDCLVGGRQLNGWVWCSKGRASGWVPLQVLQVI
ncbi:SH3 domain-containing protein [Pseudomonas sp. SBB6]|uniref:SH3 domain-containing protein n=1 Tax=Pseudomonas sp. SBB6 TaxID=2962032 RepID=UPI0020B68024|nr:SH3 domain-containing protein [Pseudomonas sp. SBB6]